MNENDPPPWGNDTLSTFLSNAQQNERITSINMPDVYALLQRTQAIFERLMEITEKENTPELLPSRFLMARARGAWLGAVREGMSGQTVEVYPLIRATVENAWYALHIAKDPAPPARAEVWLRRRENDSARKRCKSEFTVANVRATHEALDPATAAALDGVYEHTIELGGHPNELAVLSSLRRTETDKAYTFEAAFLTDNPLLIALALKSAVEAAVGAMRAFRLVFPERFAIMGVDDDLNLIAAEHNVVFKRYVPPKT